VPASIRIYVNSSTSGIRRDETSLSSLHSAICTNCSSSSLIRNSCVRESSCIRDESRRCRPITHERCIVVANLFSVRVLIRFVHPNTIFRFVHGENFTQTKPLSYFPLNSQLASTLPSCCCIAKSTRITIAVRPNYFGGRCRVIINKTGDVLKRSLGSGA
jgi:hypothetical protein